MTDTLALAKSMYAVADMLDAYIASASSAAGGEENTEDMEAEIARLSSTLQVSLGAEAEIRAQLTFAQDEIARLKRSGRSTRTSTEATRARK